MKCNKIIIFLLLEWALRHSGEPQKPESHVCIVERYTFGYIIDQTWANWILFPRHVNFGGGWQRDCEF